MKRKKEIIKITRLYNYSDRYSDTRKHYNASKRYIDLADYYYEKSNIDKAEEILLTAAAMPYMTKEVFLNLGILEQNRNNFEKSIGYFEQAVNIDNEYIYAYCMWAASLTELKEYEQAEEIFFKCENILNNKKRKFQDKEVSKSDLNLRWRICFFKQKKFRDAMYKFKEASRLDYMNFHAIYLWAISEFELKYYQEALEKFEVLNQVSLDHYDARYYIAKISNIQGKLDKALDYALQSLSLCDKKIETYLLLIEIFRQKEDYINADKYFQRALSKGFTEEEIERN